MNTNDLSARTCIAPFLICCAACVRSRLLNAAFWLTRTFKLSNATHDWAPVDANGPNNARTILHIWLLGQ